MAPPKSSRTHAKIECIQSPDKSEDRESFAATSVAQAVSGEFILPYGLHAEYGVLIRERLSS